MVSLMGAAPVEAAEEALKRLRIVLPTAPSPLGAYVPAVQTGALLFLSGMVPIVDGKPYLAGRIGAELTVDQGREATHIAARNALAVAWAHLGTLDRITRVVRLAVFQVATDTFREHAVVADAASELFRDIFGVEKSHSRLVSGIAGLPHGLCVELEVIFEVAVE
jgi:enamine deaminase RidA (YjgF/YER057c/UK114 family)